MKENINLQGLNWFDYEQSWVLLYFSTSWCAPCKSMGPLVDEISTLYVEHFKTIKIDVDEQMQLAKELDVKGVPTLILLDKVNKKSSLVGGTTAIEIKHWLNTQLNMTHEQKANLQKTK